MKSFVGLLLAFSALHTAVATAAPWDRYDIKDAMRGTITHGASLKVKSINSPGVDLSMDVIDKGEKEQAIILTLSGGRIACEKHICDVSVRFDNSDVTDESMAVSDDRATILPTKTSAFSGAVGLSKIVFVEIKLKSGAAAQFKFDVDEPAFPRVQTPTFKFAGVSLGGSPEHLRPEFSAIEANKNLDCREAKALRDEVPGITIPSVRVCFYRGMLYMAFISTSSKVEYDAVARLMTAQLGKSDADSRSPSWPASTDKVLDVRAVRVNFWPEGQVRGAGRFLVFDESIALTIPK